MPVRPPTQQLNSLAKFTPSGNMLAGVAELAGDNLILSASPVEALKSDSRLQGLGNGAGGNPIVNLDQLSNGWEGGTQGNSVSTSSSDPGQSFDGFTTGSGSTITYDAAPLTVGSWAARFDIPASGGAALNQYIAKFGEQTEFFVRLYYKLNTLPTTFHEICDGSISGIAARPFQVGVTSAGKFIIKDFTGATAATSVATISLGTTYRLELHFSGVNFQNVALQVYIGANSEGTTPDETLVTSLGTNLGPYNTISSIRFGNATTQTTAITFWLDAVVINSAARSWVGPAAKPIAPASISATSTVGGSVSKAKVISPTSNINATSTVTGKVTALRRIAPSTSISATSTVSGALRVLRAIRPTTNISATSTVSGALRVLRAIRPTTNISATSTVSGAVQKLRPITPTTSISATSTVSGSIRVLRAIRPTTNIAATSTLSGSIVVRRRIQPPTGVAAISTVSGLVTVLRAVKPVNIAATSTVTGGVRKLAAIAGTVLATSTVSGNLTGPKRISGAIAATSTVTGSLRLLRPILPAQISSISAVSGSLVVRRAIRPTTISATSTLFGAISVRRRVLPSGIAATSTVTGVIHALKHFVGSVFATSTVSGKIVRVVHFRGNVAATSTVTGHIVAKRRIPVFTINATSTVTGHIIVRRAIRGNIFATSTVTAHPRLGHNVYGRNPGTLISATYDPAFIRDAGDEIPIIVSVK